MAGPRWVKLDVDYWTNPKARRAGREGRSLHLCAAAWCGANWKTNGFIPDAVVPLLLASAEVPRSSLLRLAEAGLILPGEGGWDLHHFTELNGTAEDVQARIEAERRRKANWRAAKARRRDGDVPPGHGRDAT